MLALGLSLILFQSCTRIDAGYEGILIKQYGTDKGVQDVNLVTGRVWYNPWTEDVDQFPTFVQTVDYDPFTVNAKDGSIFTVDPIMSFHIATGKTPNIYKKYRKPIDEIKISVLYNYTKDAFKNVFNTYTTDSILSRRQEFDNKVTALLTQELKEEGFEIDQLTFGMTYPETILKAIEAKNESVQKAQQRQNDYIIAKKDSAIKVLTALAEAKANELKQKTLTPLLMQEKFIDKWDGHSALYGNAPVFTQATR